MFVLKAQYIPNTYLVCIEYVFGLYWELSTNACIGMYGKYWYVFICICKYLHVLCIDMYQLVFPCIACIGMHCIYLFVFVLVCIGVYLYVLSVLACMVCIGIYCKYWCVWHVLVCIVY